MSGQDVQPEGLDARDSLKLVHNRRIHYLLGHQEYLSLAYHQEKGEINFHLPSLGHGS